MEIYPRKKNCCPTGAWDADLIRAGACPPLGRRRSKDGWVKGLARLRTGGGAF